MTKKRKTPRQQPPAQSQTQRPRPVTKKPGSLEKTPRKGFVSLTPVEVEVFLEMKTEAQQIQAAKVQLQIKEQTLLERHAKIIAALGKARSLDFPFKVVVNEKSTGLNYEEVPDDGAEGDAAGPGPKA